MNTRDALADTLFKQVVRHSGIIRHKSIPPGAKTWQSEAETSHWIIEKELYDYMKFSNIGNLAPLESLRNERNKNCATLPKEIMDFPSCILDNKFNQFMKSGYHVGLVTNILFRIYIYGNRRR
jgi:hypothetical protein